MCHVDLVLLEAFRPHMVVVNHRIEMKVQKVQEVQTVVLVHHVVYGVDDVYVRVGENESYILYKDLKYKFSSKQGRTVWVVDRRCLKFSSRTVNHTATTLLALTKCSSNVTNCTKSLITSQ